MKSITTFVGLAFAASAAAFATPAPAPAPAPAPESDALIVHSTFSFVEWVDSILTDPENALSPEEAVAAFTAGSASLEKRQTFANCQQITSQPAQAPDAVWCINRLAARGAGGQNCDVSSTQRSHCIHGSAEIVTVRGTSTAPKSVNCNDLARAAGLTMDRCTRGDNTVSGVSYIPQGGVAVHIVHS